MELDRMRDSALAAGLWLGMLIEWIVIHVVYALPLDGYSVLFLFLASGAGVLSLQRAYRQQPAPGPTTGAGEG